MGTFAPPWSEWPGNPVFKTPASHPDGYENCEFFMGPMGEAGHARGLLHVLCNFHGGNGPSGYAHGPQPHFVTDPFTAAGALRGGNWIYAGALSTGSAGEPTPVYEPAAATPGVAGVPGDAASVRYFIARQELGDRRLTIGLYKLDFKFA